MVKGPMYMETGNLVTLAGVVLVEWQKQLGLNKGKKMNIDYSSWKLGNTGKRKSKAMGLIRS